MKVKAFLSLLGRALSLAILCLFVNNTHATEQITRKMKKKVQEEREGGSDDENDIEIPTVILLTLALCWN